MSQINIKKQDKKNEKEKKVITVPKRKEK